MLAVLVVEDELFIRLNEAETLRRAGFQVTEAANSREALAHIRDGRVPDMLVTDIRMPGSIDGLALAHIVAQWWPDTVIVICSDTTPGELPANAVFVPKPVNEWQLLAAVEQARQQAKRRLEAVCLV